MKIFNNTHSLSNSIMQNTLRQMIARLSNDMERKIRLVGILRSLMKSSKGTSIENAAYDYRTIGDSVHGDMLEGNNDLSQKCTTPTCTGKVVDTKEEFKV